MSIDNSHLSVDNSHLSVDGSLLSVDISPLSVDIRLLLAVRPPHRQRVDCRAASRTVPQRHIFSGC
jgi:hypothetical protein